MEIIYKSIEIEYNLPDSFDHILVQGGKGDAESEHSAASAGVAGRG